MIEDGDQWFSSYIFHTLDCMGYSKHIQRSRIEAMNKLGEMSARVANEIAANVRQNLRSRTEERIALGGSVTILAVGSSADGVSNMFKSDLDFLMLYDDIVCVSNPGYDSSFTELKPDFTDVSPGYVRLKAPNIVPNVLGKMIGEYCLCGRARDGLRYLSSSKFRENLDSGNRILPLTTYHGISQANYTSAGPASSTDIVSGFRSVLPNTDFTYHSDTVGAFYFFCSDALKRWTERERFFSWPTKEVIKAVSISNVYVVPVGAVGSENYDTEWRISFVEAEKILLTNTNDTQLKLYAMLKLIHKEVIQPVCPSVSSYMIKNVMLWTCERVPTCFFVPTQLICVTMHALWFFRHSLQNNHLPNYMLPERNLILERVFGDEKDTLKDLLSKLLTEKERIIFRLPTLANYLCVMKYMPDFVTLFGLWRDKGEELLLIKFMNEQSHSRGMHFAKKTAFIDIMWEAAKAENFYDVNMPFVTWFVPEFFRLFFEGRLNHAFELLYIRIKTALLGKFPVIDEE